MTKGKILLIVTVLCFLLLVVITTLHCTPLKQCPWERDNSNTKPKRVTLTFVGAWDRDDDWAKIIADFKDYEIANRNLEVTVQYEQLDKYNYRYILFDRQLNKKGPNMYMIFNRWLPDYTARSTPMPEGYMTLDKFDQYFPEVAKQDLVIDGKIYALPMYVDTLGLYYNKDILYNNGLANPPETWEEFADYVEKLSKQGADGKFERMGASIGGSDIVNRSQDIVMLMVMQNNLKTEDSKNPVSFQTREAQQAVKFYTDFADPKKRVYTWDYNDRTYSIDAFTQGRAAMSINYAYEIADIESKTSGSLKYMTAPVPQQYPDQKINYASYWAPVVSNEADCAREEGVTESCSDISWDFLSFAAQADNARSYVESTGRPAANLTLVKEQSDKDGSKLAPFAKQVLTARSWGNPKDEITDEALLEMIESIITTDKTRKKEVDDAMSDIVHAVKDLE